MDQQLLGWVMENPPVKAALDALHADNPQMQAAFLAPGIRRAEAAGEAVAGIDPMTVVVKPRPGAEARWAITPDGETITLGS